MRPAQADNWQGFAPNSGAGAGPRWRLPYAERPRYLQLETVTKCNAKCPFCPQNEIKRDPARMPDAMWKKIVDDTRGWGVTYRPFLTNEPFVDKRQPEIVRYIKQNDPTARVEFNTNAELLSEDLGRELLEAGVDIMRFSIDGFSAATYEPSRVGIPYQKVLERTTRFWVPWEHARCELVERYCLPSGLLDQLVDPRLVLERGIELGQHLSLARAWVGAERQERTEFGAQSWRVERLANALEVE